MHRRQVEYMPQSAASDVAIARVPFAIVERDWKIYPRWTGPDGREFPAAILRGFPADQMTGGTVCLKERIADFSCGCYNKDCVGPCSRCLKFLVPLPVYRFPLLDGTALPPRCAVLAGHKLGVWTGAGGVPAQVHKALRKELHRLGLKRKESPASMYHNVIDPNVGASDGAWVPVDVKVKQVPVDEALQIVRDCARAATGSELEGEIVRSIKAHMKSAPSPAVAEWRSEIPDVPATTYPKRYGALEVFNVALPLLARLKLPALLLPGPLQVVVKAQPRPFSAL